MIAVRLTIIEKKVQSFDVKFIQAGCGLHVRILFEGFSPLLPARSRHWITPVAKFAKDARHSKYEGREVNVNEA